MDKITAWEKKEEMVKSMLTEAQRAQISGFSITKLRECACSLINETEDLGLLARRLHAIAFTIDMKEERDKNDKERLEDPNYIGSDALNLL